MRDTYSADRIVKAMNSEGAKKKRGLANCIITSLLEIFMYAQSSHAQTAQCLEVYRIDLDCLWN